jgi:hypothetical protein
LAGRRPVGMEVLVQDENAHPLRLPVRRNASRTRSVMCRGTLGCGGRQDADVA